MEAVGITQSKASRHLATLRHAGLVVDRREAAWSYYSLRPLDSELERAQLRCLRSKLGSHASAVRALDNLHAWLARKGRDGACSSNRDR
jgi:DNA-binding transcriptional ArsR family regulator